MILHFRNAPDLEVSSNFLADWLPNPTVGRFAANVIKHYLIAHPITRQLITAQGSIVARGFRLEADGLKLLYLDETLFVYHEKEFRPLYAYTS